MEKFILSKLKKEGLIKEADATSIFNYLQQKPLSIHWEIKIVLYLGVVLLSTGAGLIIYQNLDSISHLTILAVLAITSAACFAYCFYKAQPYSNSEIKNQELLPDYLLLLGCLLFISFEGYLQFKYVVFGNHYGLAALVPTLLFFFLAYRMDHKGVLSLAITGLGTWMGLSITPKAMFEGYGQFSELTAVWTGLGFGILIASAALLLESKHIKKHFTFSYLNFAAHTLFVASLAGLFMEESLLKWFFTFCISCFFFVFFMYARREQSFYFLLISSIYSYIAVSFLYFQALFESARYDDGVIHLSILYIVISCGLIVYFFLNHKKFLKNDSVS